MQKNAKDIFDRLIEETVGLSMHSIKSKSSDEIHHHIEEKEHIKLTLGESHTDAIYYRGSMALATGRINYNVDDEYMKVFGISQD